MNKTLLIVLCMLGMIVRAAQSDKPIMCLAGSTIFLVSKDNMPSYQRILDVMVVGKREQDRLKKSDSVEEHNIIGTAFCVHDKKIYTLTKASQIISADDSNKTFPGGSKLCKKINIAEVGCDLMYVIEPILSLKNSETHTPQTLIYCLCRAGSENPYAITYHNFLGDNALEQASKDLVLCYQNALIKGLELVKNREKKSIGLNALGKGMPRETAVKVTFKAITDFISVHNGYNFVQLFVKNRSEFNMYNTLMMEYNKNR